MAKYIHVVLKVPKPRRNLYTYAKIVRKSLAGNPGFSTADLAVLDARIEILNQAETAAGHREPGAAAACAAAREAVRQELNHLRDFVQGVLEEQAGTVDLKGIQALVESAAMDLRKVSVRAKAVFGATYGAVAGSVNLTAPASRQRDPHEWQHSADQLTWLVLPSTRQARTTVTGLPVGVAQHFRHRTLTKGGYTEWSDPTVALVVR